MVIFLSYEPPVGASKLSIGAMKLFVLDPARTLGFIEALRLQSVSWISSGFQSHCNVIDLKSSGSCLGFIISIYIEQNVMGRTRRRKRERKKGRGRPVLMAR